eukprot:CAMPEP_0182903120 /NCGR_PEP_ID=MMETSP0034_2-20130328/31016_1 /TAXON_ID=156128 /ORGANISM="Nephroselmis pyriformis, Strain CCMP717" /LENGTH=69 /DNA_ID=CAMNT_0025037929 /DNA_START=321 /DNA_END=527 /DNA_ORIENTATION=+
MNYTERAAGGEHPRHGGISLGVGFGVQGQGALSRRSSRSCSGAAICGGTRKNPQALAALGKAVRVGLGS